MTTLGILGKGFVGSAVMEGMRHAFIVLAYDKKTGWGWANRAYPYPGPSPGGRGLPPKYPEALSRFLSWTDGPIFICLPTPMNPDGSCHTGIVEEAVHSLNKANEGEVPRTVVIKSTVPPDLPDRLDQECSNLLVCFNPEFLREATAVEDFRNQDRIILGGPPDGVDELEQVYSKAFPEVPLFKTTSTTACLVKYLTNCFLATKVSLLNEFAQICGRLGVEYDELAALATMDYRLGHSHWDVPGPDGKIGWGGSCWPKDINAMMRVAEAAGVDPTVMRAAWAKNLEVRPERDWEALVGRAVLGKSSETPDS